jgi:hypothetical protein
MPFYSHISHIIAFPFAFSTSHPTIPSSLSQASNGSQKPLPAEIQRTHVQRHFMPTKIDKQSRAEQTGIKKKRESALPRERLRPSRKYVGGGGTQL